ncbi:uncharacterized protein LOC144230101 isoform X2 [Crocuta crocuta]
MYLEAELTLSRIKVGRHFSSQSHTLKLIRYYPVNGTTLTIIGAQNSLRGVCRVSMQGVKGKEILVVSHGILHGEFESSDERKHFGVYISMRMIQWREKIDDVEEKETTAQVLSSNK